MGGLVYGYRVCQKCTQDVKSNSVSALVTWDSFESCVRFLSVRSSNGGVRSTSGSLSPS